MVAGFPPRGWYSSFLFRQQRWWRYCRRVFSWGLLAPRCIPRACLAASYLIRRLSTALLGAGHYRVAVCTCSSWPTASEPLEITVLFKISRVPISFRSFSSASFSFLPSIQRRSGTFRSLALLLRSYSGFEGNLRPRERKMDEGLSRATLLRVSKESKLLKRLRPQILAPLFRIRFELSIAWHGCFSRGIAEKNVTRTKKHEVMKEYGKEIMEEVLIFFFYNKMDLLWSKIFLLF